MEKLFIGFCAGAFVILMAVRGAALRDERDQLAHQVTEQQRVITQLANRPTPAPIVIRVPAQPLVVYAPTPAVQWWVVVPLAGGLTLGGGAVLFLFMLGRRGRDPVLYPGAPGFDEAAGAAARAAGGVVTECEGSYYLSVPGRDPVRVRRLIEQKG